jgi:hypothetical protein
MANTPLDAPTEFIPAIDERPAGRWMEGYWAEIAHWAKYFALAILVYFGWSLYNNFILAFSRSDHNLNLKFVAFYGVFMLFETPLVFLGYYCLLFAKHLERALASQDQLILEKAFQLLQYTQVWALVLAAIWGLSAVGQWIAVLNL